MTMENNINYLYKCDIDGTVIVKKGEKYNIKNKKEKMILNVWCEYVGFVKNGFYMIKQNNKFNFINAYGKLLFTCWFDWAGMLHKKLITVIKNKKYNFINLNGCFLLEQWIDDIEYNVNNNKFIIYLNDEQYIMDVYGNIIHVLNNYNYTEYSVVSFLDG